MRWSAPASRGVRTKKQRPEIIISRFLMSLVIKISRSFVALAFNHTLKSEPL